jgi:AcrR family transcriptional regulator
LVRTNGQAAIKDTAQRIFAERGYHGASIRQIATEAQLSLSAMYYYYSSKQDLLLALIEDGFAGHEQFCEQELERVGDDPVERLSALVRGTVRYRIERKDFSLLAWREIERLEGKHRRRMEERRAAVMARFEDPIKAGIRAGVFTTPYPKDARRAVTSMCNAIAQWYRPGGELSPEEVQTRYVHLALAVVGHVGACPCGACGKKRRR